MKNNMLENIKSFGRGKTNKEGRLPAGFIFTT